jgi:hypothetical protein
VHDWFALIASGFSVPFTVFSFYASGPATKTAFAVLAASCFGIATFWLWMKEYQAAHKTALQFKLNSTDPSGSVIRLEAPDLSRLSAEVVVRFENEDTERLYVTNFELSICEKLKLRRYRTLITKRAFRLVCKQHNQSLTASWNQSGLPVEGRHVTAPYIFMFAFDLPDGLSNKLDKKHFVRLTMTAMKQPEAFADYTLDWNLARGRQSLELAKQTFGAKLHPAP